MADGRHVGKYSKCHNSPTNWQTGTQIGWSHPIMSPTCPLWCGYHGNLATAHWTFWSYGHLEAERVNQFWWNLVNKRKLGPQRQSRDQILFFLNSKWRTAAMLENIQNVITHLSMDRLRPNLGGHIVTPPTAKRWLSVVRCVRQQSVYFVKYLITNNTKTQSKKRQYSSQTHSKYTDT